MKRNFLTLLTMTCSLLILLSCQNPIEPPQSEKPADGTGYFSLAVGRNAGRTIMPTIMKDDFSQYTLQFFTAGTTANPVTTVTRTNSNLAEPVELTAGTYDLRVSAYLNGQIAAQGSLSNIVIGAGQTVTRNVTLGPITGSEQGTFKWDISFENPDNVASSSMTITPLDAENGTAAQTIDLLTTEDNSCTLNSGYYRVVFKLFNNEELSIERREVLHIYQNMESAFTCTFKDNQFIESSSLTIVINIPGNDEWDLVEQAVRIAADADHEFLVEGTYAEYKWYLDGEPVETEPTYIFNQAPGVYELALVVTDDAGEKRSASCRVTVASGQQPPEVEIEIPHGGTIIRIGSQADLESIRSHIDDPAYNYGKNAYVLERDITLSGTWTPIGSVGSAFKGNFYGNGHTIRNLVLPGGSIRDIGLFGYIEDALIQGLQVELGDNVISVAGNASQNIGIIAGTHKNSVIRNCGVYSLSEVVINATTSGWNWLAVGGIVSQVAENNSSSIIEDCYVNMNIKATFGGPHLQMGGIAVSADIIRNCYYVGNITGSGTYAELRGVAHAFNTIETSYTAGKIINNVNSSSYTNVYGIGSGGSSSIISNSVTLMEQIYAAAGANYARRISADATRTNNYAYAGMLLNSSTVTSSDPNSQNGLDKTASQLKQRSTYESGLGWDFNTVWEMGPSEYPFPIFKWQNGVVKLPQGFNVIGGAAASFNVSTASEFNAALSAIQSGSGDGFIITLLADINLSPQDLSGTAFQNKTITLKGNTPARTISLSGQGSLFTVGANAELVLEDIVLQGISNNNTSLVKVNANGTLVVNSGGKITGNTYSTSVNETGGAGVLVDGGTLEIAGGEISGNTVNGTIRGNVRGGGVYALNGGNVLMTGGAIRENHVINVASGEIISADGGGIFIYNNSSFEMTGGVIEGNSTDNRSSSGAMCGGSGGGVNISKNSSFDFKGGIIRNNTANATGNSYTCVNGGGVAFGDSSTMIMSGGIINGNSVISSSANSNYSSNPRYDMGAYGGGVAFGSGNTFVKTGGIIYGNEVNGNDADGIPLKNTAGTNNSGLGGGHAVYYSIGTGDSNPRRNTTVGETADLYTSGSTLADGRPAVVPGGQREVTIAMWDSYGDAWDGNAALRINVNGTDLSATARKSTTGGNGPVYHTFTVNAGNTVQIYWVSGGQYDYECAFAVYYSNDPPSPAFDPSSGTTGGKVLVSKRYSTSGAVGNGTLMGSFTVSQ